ncbi:hypothetical protein BCR42DRAFT_344415 [Absidia repens]|uniref:Transcriptional regulatory protein RXT2 N-terminal domain-containing protein n=1 Tax=Absidia repens TaxID=90262 RepID=A0A1X2IX47_9FUNG|nr:hypothetical protein BCR42DRAFT_344415 [Absidia repens]
MSETSRPERETPAKKWINDNESDSDQEVGLVPHNRGYKLKRWAPSDAQFGGNKLRAPKTLSEETDLIKAGKKHTVVKRKRRFLEDEASDEEDPYTLINIEDILSPIETPTDIVQRPALRRILKSGQIDALAGTAMEFIEGEKNFNKVLCRLSSILHQDDPQYLDLNFDNASPMTNGSTTTTDALFKTEVMDNETDTTTEAGHATEDDATAVIKKEDDDAAMAVTTADDENAAEVVRHVKELLLENINYSNEYLARLQGARDKLTKARLQKDALYAELQSQLAEQRRPSTMPRRR